MSKRKKGGRPQIDEGYKQKILETLGENSGLSVRELREMLGVKPGTEDMSRFTETFTYLEGKQGKQSVAHPTLKVAMRPTTKGVERDFYQPDVYVYFRTEDEESLTKDGVLKNEKGRLVFQRK